MVVDHLQDANSTDLASIKSAVGKKGKRAISWFEDQPISGPQVKCELASAIAGEGMATPGHASHVGQRVCRLQRRQAALEPLPLWPAPSCLLVAGTKVSELGVGEFNYDRVATLGINGIG
jgi:hypothetical protein